MAKKFKTLKNFTQIVPSNTQKITQVFFLFDIFAKKHTQL